MLVGVLVVVVNLSADPRRNADDHGWNRDAREEGDTDRSQHDGPQLPKQFLLPRPETKRLSIR